MREKNKLNRTSAVTAGVTPLVTAGVTPLVTAGVTPLVVSLKFLYIKLK